ncbi:MAG: STAS domain-containing protein [Gammaproteobacteria bacterium]|nr:STAS domain-containing protein [Gammaproteobacteria bacterium]
MAEVSGARIEAVSADRLLVSGDLVFSTVGGLLAASRSLMAATRQPVIDLSGVQRCDSAGLALLFEWLEIGAMRHARPVFVNLPAPLLGIARLSNAESLLPVGA